jgi:hypothetical protein
MYQKHLFQSKAKNLLAKSGSVRKGRSFDALPAKQAGSGKGTLTAFDTSYFSLPTGWLGKKIFLFE